MLKEAIQHIEDLCRAAGEMVFSTPVEPEAYFMRGKDGLLVKHAAPLPLRSYAAFTLPDLADQVKHFGADGNNVVFVGNGAVTAILDEDKRRREQVRFGLTKTSEFETLKHQRSSRPGHTQKEFINLLRVELAGCAPPQLIASVRNLKFSRSSDGQSHVGTGKESVSSEVKRSLLTEGGDPLPDEVAITVNVYEEWRSKSGEIRCSLDVDIDEAELRLIPMAGELERLQRETDTAIAEVLRQELGDIAAVFLGSA